MTNAPFLDVAQAPYSVGADHSHTHTALLINILLRKKSVKKKGLINN